MDARILIWAHPRDARLTCEFLEEAGFVCVACHSWEALLSEWPRGAGALVLAGELMSSSVVARLQALLAAEPAWSDPAIVIVGGEGAAAQIDEMALGNVSLLQRPLSLKTLRSTVRAALRARRRQYQVRDLLEQKTDAERRKDEFLAMLAHELRNPLAPLRTGLQLLRLGPPADTVARTQAMMERQITNLTRLVDDLLDVSRIMRGRIALDKRPTDFRECVRQAVDAVQYLASEKGLRLDCAVTGAPLVVAADAVRLEQMIGNVLSNAIRFTPMGGFIRVSVLESAGHATLQVADSGVGIPQQQLSHVFDLFAQAPRALARSEGGLGLGLTVVRLIAELHGGTVEIFSKGPGTGTEVAVRLPMISGAPVEGPHTAGTSAATAGHRRVLVVEDNHDVADMLAGYLEQIGHRVMVAHDGYAGLEAAFRYRPEVLICDIGLPGLDGYAIASRLREESDFSTCLMIAITGYGDVADREKARGAGFAHHLTKPADPVLVADLIAATPRGGEQVRSVRQTLD